MITGVKVNSSVQCSTFESDKGAQEFFIMVSAEAPESFPGALDELYESYTAALEQCGLSSDTLVFARFHLSDIAGQRAELEASQVYLALKGGAVSIVEQPPLDNRYVNLFCYHVRNRRTAYRRRELTVDGRQGCRGVAIEGEHYTMLWNVNQGGRGYSTSQHQAREVFGNLTDVLGQEGMNLLGNTVRTWIFVKDIDNNYTGMVKARRELFEKQGLTKDTRFIASTGIEGNGGDAKTIVSLDSLSLSNLMPGQIVRMEALDNLSPTIQYGVTFERGSRIRFGDRSHLYLSGTASINREGNVVHIGDVERQTSRTLKNIKALLHPHEATLADMAYVLVYLRNSKEFEQVRAIVEQEMPPHVPRIYMESAVCRPEWLVEIEGMAVIPDNTEFPGFF